MKVLTSLIVILATIFSAPAFAQLGDILNLLKKEFEKEIGIDNRTNTPSDKDTNIRNDPNRDLDAFQRTLNAIKEHKTPEKPYWASIFFEEWEQKIDEIYNVCKPGGGFFGHNDTMMQYLVNNARLPKECFRGELEICYFAGGRLYQIESNLRDVVDGSKLNRKCTEVTSIFVDKTFQRLFKEVKISEIYNVHHDAYKQNLRQETERRTMQSLQEERSVRAAKEKIESDKESQILESCLSSGRVSVCDLRAGVPMWECFNRICSDENRFNVIFKSKNNSSSEVRDVVFRCDSIARSGTVIRSESHTLFDLWMPGEVRTVNLSFLRVPQTKSIRCSATTWK